jgi:hypothetical protein
MYYYRLQINWVSLTKTKKKNLYLGLPSDLFISGSLSEVCYTFLTHVTCPHLTSYPSWFHHSHNICRSTQIMMLLTIQCSLSSCYSHSISAFAWLSHIHIAQGPWCGHAYIRLHRNTWPFLCFVSNASVSKMHINRTTTTPFAPCLLFHFI